MQVSKTHEKLSYIKFKQIIAFNLLSRRYKCLIIGDFR